MGRTRSSLRSWTGRQGSSVVELYLSLGNHGHGKEAVEVWHSFDSELCPCAIGYRKQERSLVLATRRLKRPGKHDAAAVAPAACVHIRFV